MRFSGGSSALFFELMVIKSGLLNAPLDARGILNEETSHAGNIPCIGEIIPDYESHSVLLIPYNQLIFNSFLLFHALACLLHD
jgi:hypothetical protein